jgi:hypothetical protein
VPLGIATHALLLDALMQLTNTKPLGAGEFFAAGSSSKPITLFFSEIKTYCI